MRKTMPLMFIVLLAGLFASAAAEPESRPSANAATRPTSTTRPNVQNVHSNDRRVMALMAKYDAEVQYISADYDAEVAANPRQIKALKVAASDSLRSANMAFLNELKRIRAAEDGAGNKKLVAELGPMIELATWAVKNNQALKVGGQPIQPGTRPIATDPIF